MLDFFREILSSLKSTSIDRVKNPYIGAFCFSWVAFNWESVLVLLFSEKNVEDKIAWINMNSSVLHALIYPALFTGMLLSFLPVISAMVMWVQDKPLGFVMRKYMERDEQTLDRKIGVEKKRALASVAFKRVVADEELEIQRLNAKVQDSKNESEKLQAKIEGLEKENVFLNERVETLSAKERELNKLAEETIKGALALNDSFLDNKKLKSEVRSLLNEKANLNLFANSHAKLYEDFLKGRELSGSQGVELKEGKAVHNVTDNSEGSAG